MKQENAVQHTKLKVSEIFYSLQGEGVRQGEPTIFIRLQGCSAKYACYQIGVRCDTEFESGKERSLYELHQWALNNANNCKCITWTGGEPLDQLTSEIIQYFKDNGFYQTVETSGLKPCPDNIDFITVSPKVAEHVVKKNFPNGVTELRYVRHKGQEIPNPQIEAKYYFISPHFDGFIINPDNLIHCIKLCKENPKWRLSVQMHKVWNIL